MKKKNVFFSVLLAASLFATTFTIVSCGNNEKAKEEQYKIYQLAQERGFTGTYEQWLDSIKGADGKDGRAIELSIQEEKIVWRYVGETTWKEIYSVNDLIGPKGEDGKNGVTITSIEKTSTDELMDTYTITFSDETTATFIVTNGANGEQGIQGVPGLDGEVPSISINEDGYWVIGETITSFKPTGEIGKPGKSAYELYLEVHPEYKGTEEDWLIDLSSGKLDDKEDVYRNVQFIDENGNEVSAQKVLNFGKINKPTDLVKDGYIFLGWFVGDEKWDFDHYTVTEDLILEAKWTTPPHDATFILKDGTIYHQYKFKMGEKVKLPIDPNENFGGWKLNDKPVDRNTIINLNEDIYFFENTQNYYTYNTHTTVSPSNWNELTYQDDNELQIINYIRSNLFSFDYKFDENGNPIEGEFDITYDAATALVDVTDNYRSNPKWNIPEKGNGYAYKIILREDLKWDDGTPIKAEDFVYSMKEQLNPLFRNSRAENYFNNVHALHGAMKYAYQGSSIWDSADNIHKNYSEALDDALIFSLGNAEENSKFQNVEPASAAIATFRTNLGAVPSLTAKQIATVISANYIQSITSEQILALEGKTLKAIKADPALKATWDALINWYKTLPNEELHFFVVHHNYEKINWEDVGIFSKASDSSLKDNELVLVLDNPEYLLKEDGSLSFRAVNNMISLPLVKKDLYEINKITPNADKPLWTSTYNTSVASTASWGPYKLTSSQSGKEYVLERNPYWYGYNNGMIDGNYIPSKNNNLYQADRIVCKTIKEWDEAWLAFQKGEIDTIGIDDSIAREYRNSSQAVFTPSEFVGSLQLQSSFDSLLRNQTTGFNKTILANKNFRKAISLAFDREAYVNKCKPSSLPGLGLFNQMYYYDVENGGLYRETDEAKRAICEVYGVDISKYPSLDDAYKSITGYDLELARKLVDLAVEEELSKTSLDPNGGTYKEGDKVTLIYGASKETEDEFRIYSFIKNALKEMVKGTKLDGKLEITFENHGKRWADDFRNGVYDICLAGWNGVAWDPGYFLLAYLSPYYMYSHSWNTNEQMLTLTVPGVGEGFTDVTETMSLMEWYECLNGNPGAKYNWAKGAVPEESRLVIITALEKEILSTFYTIPIENGHSVKLISYKTEYITRDYNTFMDFGGIKYLEFKFSDAEWTKNCIENKLNYKG